jgi:predicted amino acid racemase
MKYAPRLEIDLDKIFHNARTLIQRLACRKISVTGVTKATLGSADIANVLLRAGIGSLGDSRIENIESMRHANVASEMILIRSPMMSQAARVVKFADISCNTEVEVIRQLSVEARKAGLTHRVVLMVELGDLREGIMPDDLIQVVRETLCLPNIALEGIGTNLACRSGVSPNVNNMAKLSALASLVETTTGHSLRLVSGGNSANLTWALGNADVGRVNNLRLGEAIFLGRETLQRLPIADLHTDAITLVAEVIESKIKPSKPSGVIAQNAFGERLAGPDRGEVLQTILAIGRQDIDPEGLQAAEGIRIRSVSSDHLVLESADHELSIGAEVTFGLNYSALLRAMTSPFVGKLHKYRSLAMQKQSSGNPEHHLVAPREVM